VALFFLAVALIAAMCAHFPPRYPATTLAVTLAGVLLLTVFAMHWSAQHQLHRLQPILAGAPRSDERITNDDMISALGMANANQKILPRQLVIAGVSLAVGALAMIALVISRWEEHGKFFSDPLSLLFAGYAIYLGLAATNLYRTRKNRETAVPASFVRSSF
jgi:hypothetical protein